MKVIYLSIASGLMLLIAGSWRTGANEATIKEKNKNSFIIEGSLKNLKKKAVIHLAWQGPWQYRESLKADIIDGKFRLTGQMSQPTMGTLRIVTYNDSLKPDQQVPWECDVKEIFICDGKTSIIGTDSLSTAKIISGCKENEFFQTLNRDLEQITKEQESISTALSKAHTNKDSCMVKILDKAFFIAQNKEYQVKEAFILQHPSSYLSVNLLNSYVDNVNDKIRLNLAVALLNKLPAQLRSSPLAVAIEERIDQKLYPVVGTTIQPLVLTGADEVNTDIAKFKGKVLLIDFWASWCSPCRKENPELVALYEKYRDQGFEIIGISIDNNKTAWREAIKRDRLSWPQFMERGLAYGGIASRQYRVRQLPTKFLVTREGTIIAKDMALDLLDAKLKAMLTGQKK